MYTRLGGDQDIEDENEAGKCEQARGRNDVRK